MVQAWHVYGDAVLWAGGQECRHRMACKGDSRLRGQSRGLVCNGKAQQGDGEKLEYQRDEGRLLSFASDGRRLGFCLQKARAAPGGKGLSQHLWEQWVSKGRAGSCHGWHREGSQGREQLGRAGSTTNLVVNIQVFFSHFMKWFAAANTLFKEIHSDSSGGAAGEPQGWNRQLLLRLVETWPR